MHDGQNIIDPSTSAFQVDWQIDEALDSLIKQDLIEPIIVVGIYNSIDRDNEYSEDELGYSYMNFIVDSLKLLLTGITEQNLIETILQTVVDHLED